MNRENISDTICADLSVCLLSECHPVRSESCSVFSPIPVFGWVETKWCRRSVDFDGGWTSDVNKAGRLLLRTSGVEKDGG